MERAEAMAREGKGVGEGEDEGEGEGKGDKRGGREDRGKPSANSWNQKMTKLRKNSLRKGSERRI